MNAFRLGRVLLAALLLSWQIVAPLNAAAAKFTDPAITPIATEGPLKLPTQNAVLQGPLASATLPTIPTTLSIADAAQLQAPLTAGPDIYTADFQKGLFDKLVDISYERTSGIVSMGLLKRFRVQAADLLDLKPGMTVADLMAGSGESWDYILPKIGRTGTVHAVDFSDKMVDHAQVRHQTKFPDYQVNVLNQDATKTTLPSASVDVIHSGYGVKTLPKELRPALVAEISRLLKPGGRAVLVEATLPKNKLLALAQNIYMNKVIPFVMKFLPGEYSAFLMINRYLRDFKNMDELAAEFKAQGFRVGVTPLFGGIAAVLTAEKPASRP